MVFLGRAAAYGLAAGGENGVRHALHLLRGEIDRVLALLGCPSVDELGPQFVRSAAKELVAQPPLPPVARLRVV
jgi:(S)-mandelate dehydrogenase